MGYDFDVSPDEQPTVPPLIPDARQEAFGNDPQFREPPLAQTHIEYTPPPPPAETNKPAARLELALGLVLASIVALGLFGYTQTPVSADSEPKLLTPGNHAILRYLARASRWDNTLRASLDDLRQVEQSRNLTFLDRVTLAQAAFERCAALEATLAGEPPASLWGLHQRYRAACEACQTAAQQAARYSETESHNDIAILQTRLEDFETLLERIEDIRDDIAMRRP